MAMFSQAWGRGHEKSKLGRDYTHCPEDTPPNPAECMLEFTHGNFTQDAVPRTLCVLLFNEHSLCWRLILGKDVGALGLMDISQDPLGVEFN